MPIRRPYAALIAGAISVPLLLAGCAAAPSDTAGSDDLTSADSAVSSDLLACAVSGAGGWHDKSFNEQVYTGLEQAESDFGIETIAFESKTDDDFAPGLASLVDQGCDLIFSVGFGLNDAVNDAAVNNPEVNFVTIDGFVKDESTTNLKAIAHDMTQSAFLGGYFAAELSESKVIATFGAIQNAAITDFMTGYYNGAQHWAEENSTPVSVLGWDPSNETGVFVGDFTNQVSAKSIGAAQLDQGADMLFPVAGPLFAAVGEAIRDAGANALFLGVDADVALTSPEFADLIPASVEKRMTAAVLEVIEDAANGEFSTEAYIGTLANDGTGLSDFHDFADHVSPELQAKLDELIAGIADGSITTAH